MFEICASEVGKSNIIIKNIINIILERLVMEDKITLCGDNCVYCPRYNAHDENNLNDVAKLWYKVGWRDKIVTNEEIRCNGCSSHIKCTYQLIDCIKGRDIDKCNQCHEFPCEKIERMLNQMKIYQKKCREVCSDKEYTELEKAFFEKERNLQK